jgi:hypothetical protein
MRRRRLLLGGGALLLAACAPPATPTPVAKPAGLPVLLESPPDLAGAKTWFNSKPLTLADLRGQPFLMVFWTYT